MAAVVLIALYYGLRNAEHAHSIELARLNHVGTSGGDASSSVLNVDAEPYPFNPFHWHVIVETPDYFQTAEVQTLSDLVTTSDVNDRIAKPPVTSAVAAAKQSWLGRVYLGWAKFPITRDIGRELPPDYASDASLPQTLNARGFRGPALCLLGDPGQQRRAAADRSVGVCCNQMGRLKRCTWAKAFRNKGSDVSAVTSGSGFQLDPSTAGTQNRYR